MGLLYERGGRDGGPGERGGPKRGGRGGGNDKERVERRQRQFKRREPDLDLEASKTHLRHPVRPCAPLTLPELEDPPLDLDSLLLRVDDDDIPVLPSVYDESFPFILERLWMRRLESYETMGRSRTKRLELAFR